MVLNIRQKQADALVRMLHFNNNPSISLGRPEDETYKVLILDNSTKDILAPLLHVNELRRHGVTLHLLLDSDRQPIPDVPAVYFVKPTDHTITIISNDAQRGLYDSLHVNFSTHIPRPLLEKLASGVVPQGAARIARIYDQHAQFVSLESGLFTLDLPNAYLDLNDPRAQDTAIESTVHTIVEGLFCVLATLGVVPIIRCPPNGAAEHVASLLDAKLRDALRSRNNVFNDTTGSSGGGSTGLSASLHRPLLCLFDRNFELSVALQHAWTYKPLVHDVLNMKLNRVVTNASSIPQQSAMQPTTKSYEVDDTTDFFWREHGREQFPKIAEQVEVELSKYKASIEELNRATGANVDPTADINELMSASTRGLMSAVSSLPELTERKKIIDKHTNLATMLLQSIKQRGLDQFYRLEEELIAGKADADAVVAAMRGAASLGTPTDKLRLSLVWLLTTPSVPSESDCQNIEAVLTEVGADMSAWAYVKRMRRMNLTGAKSTSNISGLGGVESSSQLSSLLGSTFGQGLTSLTKGVKNLLAGEQQAAVTVAVESLMENKPAGSGGSGVVGGGSSGSGPSTDNYVTFDPRAPAGRAQRPTTPFKEAIVFMIGGGNYLEWESLLCWAARAQPTAKTILYGATDVLSGDEMIGQLAELGRRSS